MYIDCHGHFTTLPAVVKEWRDQQIEAIEKDGKHIPASHIPVSDEDIALAIKGQIALQEQFGVTATIFSPTAGRMAHHYGDQDTSATWSRLQNDVIAQACRLFPANFVGVGQLPQSPGAPIDECVRELERCVNELGFVGCNLNPDPSDGYWQSPAITDEYYYPLYQKMVELDVPAMVHPSMSCNPAVHHTCAHYLNGDTTVFMQLCLSDLFTTFPKLKLIIPHGGGAVPYHWGRYRGVMQDLGRRQPEEIIGDNIFFDTCVYWRPGLELLVSSVPTANILYASEMIGAVRGVDPRTGHRYDDTRYLLDGISSLTDEQRTAISSRNALRVYGRLERILRDRGHDLTVPSRVS